MLFMKGSPSEPRCGFSAKVVDALRQADVDFKHFDILGDDAVRQGLKVHHTPIAGPMSDNGAASQQSCTASNLTRNVFVLQNLKCPAENSFNPDPAEHDSGSENSLCND